MISKRELKRLVECDGPQKTSRHIQESLAAGDLKPGDFSLRDLFEATVPDGREALDLLNPAYQGDTTLREASAVNVALFSNITGQIVYSRVMDAYTNEAFGLSALVPTIQTSLSGEKIPGFTNLGSGDAQIVAEREEYPTVGFSEDYVETPETLKRGFILPLTKEAVFFDRTGQILTHAGRVGEVLGVSKEIRITDAVCGVSTLLYKWRGTQYNTYQTSTPWNNVASSNALADWSNVDTADQRFNSITDPDTGDPVIVMGDTLVVPKALEPTALRIVSATEVRHTSSSNAIQTLSANPVAGKRVVSTRWVSNRVGNGTTWFYGDPARAFAYMQNWPVTVTQAPTNSEAEFTHDIVARFKVSERGAAAVLNPRYMVKSTS